MNNQLKNLLFESQIRIHLSACGLHLATMLMRRGLARIIALLWLLVLLPVPAHALLMEKLFEVEIPVPDESKDIRRTAIADGLAEVLVRVSGDSEILQKLDPPAASPYIKQFRYVALDTVQETSADQSELLLRVHYNGTRIIEFLRQQSIPIWSVYRDPAVAWLAVRDGVNQYVLRHQDVSLLKDTATETFQRRGIPVVWPGFDSRDQQLLSFADVWAGFAGPLQKASKRYSGGPVVVASLTWDGSLWRSDWSLFIDRESWRWSYEHADYRTVIVQSLEHVADEIGEVYAVLEAPGSTDLEQVVLEIDQVGTVNAYRQTVDYLNGLSAVQSVWLTQAEPERVTFRLKLRSDLDDLLRLIRSDGKLTQLLDADSDLPIGTGTVYRFRKNN